MNREGLGKFTVQEFGDKVSIDSVRYIWAIGTLDMVTFSLDS